MDHPPYPLQDQIGSRHPPDAPGARADWREATDGQKQLVYFLHQRERPRANAPMDPARSAPHRAQPDEPGQGANRSCGADLGSRIGGVRETYDRYEYLDEKRDALAKLAALVDRITAAIAASKVVIANDDRDRFARMMEQIARASAKSNVIDAKPNLQTVEVVKEKD